MARCSSDGPMEGGTIAATEGGAVSAMEGMLGMGERERLRLAGPAGCHGDGERSMEHSMVEVTEGGSGRCSMLAETVET